MKTTKLFLLAITAIFILAGCSKDETPQVDKVTYNKDVKSIFLSKCTPCHLEGGINPSKFDDYNTAKAKIDAILLRVNLDPTAQGFMPKNGTKLSASEINTLTMWKTDGTLEN